MSQSRRLLRISLIGHVFNDMYWFIIPLLLPIIKEEFSLNYAQSGLLLSSYTIMGAFGSLITGYLGDRKGRRFILSWGFFLGSLALVLCAFSGNYWYVFLSLILLGVGISAFHPSMIAVISNSFMQKRGAVLGIFQFWGWIGTLSVVLLISFLLKVFSSWRTVLLVLSIPGFIFAPISFRFLKNLITEKRQRSESDPQYFLEEKREKVRFLTFVVFILANTLFTITYYSVANFIPTYLVEERSFNVTFASYSFLIVVGGGLFGALISGKMVDLLSSLDSLIIFVLIGGPIIIFLTLAKNYLLLITMLVLFGISYAGIYPAQQTYMAESTPQKTRGGAYGVIFCVSYIVGAIAPGITGIIADRLNLSSALRISTFPLFLAIILFFLLKRIKVHH